MIKFNCRRCGSNISVVDALAGKRGKCPQCKAVVQVPTPAAVASADDAPDIYAIAALAEQEAQTAIADEDQQRPAIVPIGLPSEQKGKKLSLRSRLANLKASSKQWSDGKLVMVVLAAIACVVIIVGVPIALTFAIGGVLTFLLLVGAPVAIFLLILWYRHRPSPEDRAAAKAHSAQSFVPPERYSRKETIGQVMLPRGGGAQNTVNWPLPITMALVFGIVALILYAVSQRPENGKDSSSGHSSSRLSDTDIQSEFQARHTGAFLQATVSGRERAWIFVRLPPDFTGEPPAAGKWTGRLVRASASASDDTKYDAVGEAVVEIDHGDGTKETFTDKEGRRRDTKVWEMYRKLDPEVARFSSEMQPLVEELIRMSAMRSVGGTFVDHSNRIIELETAIARLPRNPSDAGCISFIRASRKSIDQYKLGLEKWQLADRFANEVSAYKYVAAYKQERDIALAEGDKQLDQAIIASKEIARDAKT